MENPGGYGEGRVLISNGLEFQNIFCEGVNKGLDERYLAIEDLKAKVCRTWTTFRKACLIFHEDDSMQMLVKYKTL